MSITRSLRVVALVCLGIVSVDAQIRMRFGTVNVPEPAPPAEGPVIGITTVQGVPHTGPTDSVSSTGATLVYTIGGIATDDVGVTLISLSCPVCAGEGGLGDAETSWTRTVQLTCSAAPGTLNTITVTAFDADGATPNGTDSLAVTCTQGDVTAPSALTIVTPSSAADLSDTTASAIYGLSGTTADNIAVTAVSWTCALCVPNGGNATLVGGTNWSIANIGLTSAGVAHDIIITARDLAGNTLARTVAVTYNPGLAITTTSLNACREGTPFVAQTLTASGGSGTGYTFTKTIGSYPAASAAFALSGAGALTAGTPSAGAAAGGSPAGYYTLTFQVQDSLGATATKELVMRCFTAVAGGSHGYFETLTNTVTYPSCASLSSTDCRILTADNEGNVCAANGGCSLRSQAQIDGLIRGNPFGASAIISSSASSGGLVTVRVNEGHKCTIGGMVAFSATAASALAGRSFPIVSVPTRTMTVVSTTAAAPGFHPTVETLEDHGFVAGDVAGIIGNSETNMLGAHAVLSVPDSKHFVYDVTNVKATTTGTVTVEGEFTVDISPATATSGSGGQFYCWAWEYNTARDANVEAQDAMKLTMAPVQSSLPTEQQLDFKFGDVLTDGSVTLVFDYYATHSVTAPYAPCTGSNGNEDWKTFMFQHVPGDRYIETRNSFQKGTLDPGPDGKKRTADDLCLTEFADTIGPVNFRLYPRGFGAERYAFTSTTSATTIAATTTYQMAETGAGTLHITAAAGGGTSSSYWIADTGNPGTGGTSTGDFQVVLYIQTTAANTRAGVQLHRVNSTGVIQASSGYLTKNVTAGDKPYAFTNPALGSWAAGDRLAVEVRVTNDNIGGAAVGPTFDLANSLMGALAPFTVAGGVTGSGPYNLPLGKHNGVNAARWGLEEDGESYSPTGRGAVGVNTFMIAASRWTRYIYHVELGVPHDSAKLDGWASNCNDGGSKISSFGCQRPPEGTYHLFSLWVCDEVRACERIYHRFPYYADLGISLYQFRINTSDYPFTRKGDIAMYFRNYIAFRNLNLNLSGTTAAQDISNNPTIFDKPTK